MTIAIGAEYTPMVALRRAARKLIGSLQADSIIGGLLKNATSFAQADGEYEYNQSIAINIIDPIAVNFYNSVDPNSDLPETQVGVTSLSLELNTIAVAEFVLNSIEKQFALGVDAVNEIVRKSLPAYISEIETRLFLSTFNLASLDAQVYGAPATDFTVNTLAGLEEIFTNAKVTGIVNVVIPPDMFKELKLSAPSRYQLDVTGQEYLSRNGFVLPDYPNFRIFSSANLPTATALTNLTATGTNKVGFAFSDDSVALFNPKLQVFDSTPGVDIIQESSQGMNILITKTINDGKIAMQQNTRMRSIFGSLVYRTPAVIPILGG